MSKKKKKQKKSLSILEEVDKSLNGTYKSLMEEIEEMQLMMNVADQKARKQSKKMAKKKGGKYYDYETLRKKARMEVIEQMEGSNFLERAYKILNDISPVIVIIARLIASLILAILSIDVIKFNIKPETLKSLNRVYLKTMEIH